MQAAVEKNTGDRSKDTFRILGACADEGLSDAEAFYAVSTRTDLAGRLADRKDDDLLCCWLKVINSRQARKRDISRIIAEPNSQLVQPISLAEAHAVFRRWLGDDYDTDALDAMLTRPDQASLGAASVGCHWGTRALLNSDCRNSPRRRSGSLPVATPWPQFAHSCIYLR